MARIERGTDARGRLTKLMNTVRPSFRGGSSLPYVFLLPAFLLYALLILWSMVGTIQLSFVEWDGASAERVFVGLQNFSTALQDPIFWEAFGNNIIWLIWMVTLPVGFGLVLAVLVAQRMPNSMRTFYRTVFFLPVVLSLVVVAIIWEWVYSPLWGLLNTTLGAIGLGFLQQPWLGQADTVLPSILVAESWTYYGFCMVIFLAALQKIDPSYYEAAEIEGANIWHKFRFITVPLIMNEISFVMLFTAISAFKAFDLVFVLTKGGPNYSSEIITTMVYRTGFWESDVGYASAIAVLMTVTLMAVLGAGALLTRAIRGGKHAQA